MRLNDLMEGFLSIVSKFFPKYSRKKESDSFEKKVTLPQKDSEIKGSVADTKNDLSLDNNSRCKDNLPPQELQRFMADMITEDGIAVYKRELETNHSGENLRYLNDAIDEAYEGIKWPRVELSLRMAEKKGCVAAADRQKIKNIWEYFAPRKADKNIEYWLKEAEKAATDGEKFEMVKLYLNNASEYAKLGNIKLPEDKIQLIKGKLEDNSY